MLHSISSLVVVSFRCIGWVFMVVGQREKIWEGIGVGFPCGWTTASCVVFSTAVGSCLSRFHVGKVLLGASSGLDVVSCAEALVGGGALVIYCRVAAAELVLKEVSSGVEWKTCWL
jgi:hypothetical protein